MRRWLIALVVSLLTMPALAQAPAPKPGLAVAIFAGGCFWCMEPPFDKLDGVVATTSGYTGGTTVNPRYEDVGAGRTGHYEAVRVDYDPAKVSYATLLETFWRNIDPLDPQGQFCDKGPMYRSVIFPVDEAQRAAAEASKAALEKSGKLPGKVVTQILPASPFYAAEDYHQDYYKKNNLKYTYYRWSCGRDRRLEQLWGPQPKS